MEQAIFTQLTLVVVIAAAISLMMRLLRQPLIMGYILTGILVGPALLGLIQDGEAFKSFSEIGITLLLFIIGLGLNPTLIKSLGKPVLLTAVSILILVSGAGMAATTILGFGVVESLILSVALFFSSTIIILKVISDKRELNRLYAQISVGVIVVDDIVATLAILVVAAAGTSGGLQFGYLVVLGLKGLGLVVVLGVSGWVIMPRLSRLFAHAQELLFLFAIAWAFGIASLSSYLGFSYEVGALFAGVSLAALPYATQMGARLKPLRDFFIVLFFVHLGESFNVGQISDSIVPALLLSAIVLLGKPLAIIATLGALGYTRLTSFKSGIHLSQISEFSIILVVFATNVGIVSESGRAIITLVALITIGASTYLMKYDNAIYNKVNRLLHIFEHRNPKEGSQQQISFDAVLLGYTRGGHEFLEAFRHLKQHYLVIDYDPEVIELLDQQGVRHAYGDATDLEFLEEMNVSRAKVVVSTIDEHSVNLIVLEYLKHHHADTLFICRANHFDQANRLYKMGAAYVILPHYIGSERLSLHLKKHGISKKTFDAYRQKHVTADESAGLEEMVESAATN
jgi:Kef-type K+ transport system membrane component KefB/voltage-gated potassium channel Kch